MVRQGRRGVAPSAVDSFSDMIVRLGGEGEKRIGESIPAWSGKMEKEVAG